MKIGGTCVHGQARLMPTEGKMKIISTETLPSCPKMKGCSRGGNVQFAALHFAVAHTHRHIDSIAYDKSGP